MSQYIADENFAYTVQYHGLTAINIDRVCEIMMNETGGKTTKQFLFGLEFEYGLKWFNQLGCRQLYSSATRSSKQSFPE